VSETASPPVSPAPSQERAEQIIEAATAVMGRQGYANTSMKDVAREAGVAQGLIHYYFESKEELLVAVVSRLNRQLLSDVSQAMGEAGSDPLTQIAASVERTRELGARRPEASRLFLELAVLSLNNDALRQEVARNYSEITARTQEMIDRLCLVMPTQPPIPREDFAAVLLCAFDGVMTRALLDPNADPAALYRALAFLCLSSASSSYWMAGEGPPVDAFVRLFGPEAGEVHSPGDA
jgi:AcrR family transcriptional regulator